MSVQRFILGLLLLAAVGTAFPARADLQEQMQAMLGSLTNYSAPTAYQGQRRGVFSGGSLYVRNRIMNPNLISVTPPAFRGGCGGIDLYMGSFSFISADEFTQLLRSIAANAPGYFFQLALDAYCPDCMNQMNRLSRVVQDLTSDLSNSCQMAKTLVDAAVPESWQTAAHTGSGLIAKEIGGVADALAGLRPPASAGKSPAQQAQQSAPAAVAQVVQGNIVWRALRQRFVEGWFPQGDIDFLEAIMSLTGSLIVGEIPAGHDGFKTTPLEPLLNLHDLLVGTGRDGSRTVEIWTCGGDTGPDGCLNPAKQRVPLKGMVQRVEEILLGIPNQQVGLVARFQFNQGPIDAAQKAFMELAPGGIAAGIRDLAIKDGGMAEVLAREAVPLLAVEMTAALVEEMERALRLAASLSDHHLTPRLLENLQHRRGQLAEERRALDAQGSKLSQLLSVFTSLRDSFPGVPYAGARAGAGVRP